jgi:hypothetical protein
MKGKVNLGKFSKEENLKVFKKASRELELENSTGWTSKHKVHKSMKDFNRKPKHRNLAFEY